MTPDGSTLWPAGSATLARTLALRPPRIPGYEHVEAQSLPVGCRTLLDRQVWRVRAVTVIHDCDRHPLHVRVTAVRRHGLAELQRHAILLPWGELCPIHAASAP